MHETNPNRTKVQSVKNHFQQKKSGDEHTLPESENVLPPHKPHRLNRDDMDKIPSSDDNAPKTNQ